MSLHRHRLEMMSHANDVLAELSRLLREQRARDEALVLSTMVEGRSAWVYVDDGLEARIADLREAVAAFRTVTWRD